MAKPVELDNAQLLDTLCQRYGCLPSQLLAEDANVLLPMVSLVAIARPEADGAGLEA